MTIELELIPEKQLTIFRVMGKMTEADTMSTLRTFYEGNPTINALFDMHEADLSEFNAEKIERISYFVSRYDHLRKGGRTALVSEKDLAFGISRVAEVFGEKLKIEYHSFRKTEEAMEWLNR